MEGVTVDGHHPECRVIFGRGGPIDIFNYIFGYKFSIYIFTIDNSEFENIYF